MKNKLTELLEKGYQAEREFIASLSDKERNTNGTFEQWTAKDNVAHNSYWRKRQADDVMDVLAGRLLQVDDNKINAKVYAQFKDQSWTEIEALLDTSLKRMKEALTALSEEDLQSDKFYW